MKNLFILLIGVCFIATAALASSVKEAPYRIECYTKFGKRVKCSALDKNGQTYTKRKTLSSYNNSKKRSTRYSSSKKRSTNSARTANNQRSKALEDLSKENQQLKSELEALRKSDLIAAAQNNETTTSTAQLAAPTATKTPNPVATTSTDIAENVEEKKDNPLSANVWNAIERGFKDDEPLTNAFGVGISYKVNDNISFGTEPTISWKWTNNEDGAEVAFGDLPLRFSYSNILESKETDSSLNGSISVGLPTSPGSRNDGLIFATSYGLNANTKVNDKKGSIGIDFGFDLPFTRYTTTARPSVESIDDFNDDNKWIAPDGMMYEKLAPGTKYRFGIGLGFDHSMGSVLGFATGVRFTSSKKYADDIYTDSSYVGTSAEEEWTHEFEFVFPKFTAKLTDKFSAETSLKSSGVVAGFRPFSMNDGNNITWNFRLSYAL